MGNKFWYVVMKFISFFILQCRSKGNDSKLLLMTYITIIWPTFLTDFSRELNPSLHVTPRDFWAMVRREIKKIIRTEAAKCLLLPFHCSTRDISDRGQAVGRCFCKGWAVDYKSNTIKWQVRYIRLGCNLPSKWIAKQSAFSGRLHVETFGWENCHVLEQRCSSEVTKEP